MNRNTFSFSLLLCLLCVVVSHTHAEVPESFQKENLVAWCIVPFDSEERNPQERAAMVSNLGLKRVAYDWRENHIPEFEEELAAYQNHKIELAAFWRGQETAYPLFKEYDVAPAIWSIIPSPEGLSNKERIQSAADKMEALAALTKEEGLQLGLYNHGGWSGLPANMIGVAKELRSRGFDQVGIVYNFHHAHPRIDSFAQDLQRMLPYLQCINLNGMRAPADYDVTKSKNKIRPIGTGDKEKEMIQAILKSGYEGDIGILGHVRERDVETVLLENLAGLERILDELNASSEN